MILFFIFCNFNFNAFVMTHSIECPFKCTPMNVLYVNDTVCRIGMKTGGCVLHISRNFFSSLRYPAIKRSWGKWWIELVNRDSLFRDTLSFIVSVAWRELSKIYVSVFVVILYYHWKHKLPYCPRYIAKGLTVQKTLSERSPTKHALLYRLTTKNWGLHRQLSRERPHCTLVEEPHKRIA
jgi:hypothetical protein